MADTPIHIQGDDLLFLSLFDSAGSKVSALETTDPDWWKGMSGGRVGYFPANYVKRLRAGDKVMQVAHPFEISDRENKSEVIRLLKDQVNLKMYFIEVTVLVVFSLLIERVRVKILICRNYIYIRLILSLTICSFLYRRVAYVTIIRSTRGPIACLWVYQYRVGWAH